MNNLHSNLFINVLVTQHNHIFNYVRQCHNTNSIITVIDCITTQPQKFKLVIVMAPKLV